MIICHRISTYQTHVIRKDICVKYPGLFEEFKRQCDNRLLHEGYVFYFKASDEIEVACICAKDAGDVFGGLREVWLRNRKQGLKHKIVIPQDLLSSVEILYNE